ncbi:ribonucleoside-triphosphate reductase, adenosylcobalamin-dependent, partial [Fischerella thermalis]
TDWIAKPENFSGAYNCTSTKVQDWSAFGLLMDLAMMGCGTGAVLEPKYINQLPPIRNRLNVTIQGEIGFTPRLQRREFTEVKIDTDSHRVTIHVGDSRQGWVQSYQSLLELSTDERFTQDVQVIIDISDVRPAGEVLKGFGGVANPVKLPGLYQRCASILNKAVGRQLNSVECCLLIDEAAVTIVAGNIRRCLPEDALVHTSQGLVPIRDIQVGDLVQTPLGFRRVIDKFDQGFQEVYEIETSGTYPRGTLNHRQAVFTDGKKEITWKSVANLVEGDRLLHNTQVLPGKVTHLPPDFIQETPTQSQNIESFIVPDLTPEIAWLIGLTHAQGYIARDRKKHGESYSCVEWTINGEYGELIPKIQTKIDAALALFGVSATHTNVQSDTAKSICFSIRFAEYFHRYIKQPNIPLQVPNFILQGSVDIRAAYLAGLMDSDGAVNNCPPHLITTVYRSFIRQVAAVLSSLGIVGRIEIVYPQQKRWQAKYSLTISGLQERYNALIAPHSVKGTKQPLKTYSSPLPGTIMREAYTCSEMHSGFEGSCSVAQIDTSLGIPVTVKGLGSYDYVQTYDIEVEEAHCFYCDGYLTHNSAGMRQGNSADNLFADAKANLWQQDENGNWRIDPERDSLRMANHTRVFHSKPTLEECVDAVRKQYYSGEGAIQWAGEAVARANCDLLSTASLKTEFLQAYQQGSAKQWLQEHYSNLDERELEHRLARFGLNPCGEIIGSDFHCNLSEVHLNQIDPYNYKEQEEAFTAGALFVAALLHHKFQEPRFQEARELDPIVGVSFTGLFDFFVHAFGIDWLYWWDQGRPNTAQGLAFKHQEEKYLTTWKDIVHRVVGDYCAKHNLKCPNRCTTVQPSGTKSLLTGASPGWHPPKAQRFIRRVTFRKNDPVALACIDYGYNVTPSQSDKDEQGNLLNDPFDPRVSEWLVEIPVAVPWADLPGADEVDISKFSALSQMDFYMQVQKFYTTHNTSATIELREQEIEALGTRIYEAIRDDEGYISAALLARFDDHQAFPRLPFEPITKQQYDKLMQEVEARRKTHDFHAALSLYDFGELMEVGPAGCDSDKCMLPEENPN